MRTLPLRSGVKIARAALALSILACLAPRPIVDDPGGDGPLDGRIAAALSAGPAPLRAGLAVASLVPPRPVPLAGYIGEIAQPYRGVNAPCRARSLTVAAGGSVVSILAADFLLIDDRLARAVLGRAGLEADQVYFTASHTHSGPGGWGLHPLERLVAGTYDPEAFEFFAATLADVILRSRRRLEPAEVGFLQVGCPGLQRNRIASDLGTSDTLSAWAFRRPRGGPGSRPFALLTVFDAHATVGHPTPPRLGADYPGAFAEALEQRGDADEVLFAAGAVGDVAPAKPPAKGHHAAALAYGRNLADSLGPALRSLDYRGEVSLGNCVLPVGLPPVQYPCGSGSRRHSPLLTWWISDRQSSVRLLRLGPAAMVGFPGDYSSHLARRLRAAVPVVATSFAGDYRGYLVDRATYRDRSCYETRTMNFFGPGLGELLTARAQFLLDQLPPGP